MSQLLVSKKINNYKKKLIDRTTYIKNEKKLNINFYKSLYNDLINIINKSTNKGINNESMVIYAVDGCRINLRGKFRDKYKPNKNNETCTALVNGVYNVTYNYPVFLELVTHSDERRGFLDFDIQSTKIDIFVFDRGYFSYDFITKLNNKNINYVLRINKNSKFIDNTINDKIIYYNKIKIRIVKYSINNQDYYIATNLYDTKRFSLNVIKNIYHKRWSIEEYFKYIKLYMKMDLFNENKEDNIIKTIYSQIIVSLISKIIEITYYNNFKKHDNNKKINKNVLLNGIYDKILFKIFYKSTININNTLKFLINNYIVLYKIINNRSYPRIAKKPFLKWYFKSRIKDPNIVR